MSIEHSISKTCTKCGIIKPISEFNRKSSSRDALATECKECTKERNRNNYINRQEINKAYATEYRNKNRDRVNLWHRKNYANNTEIEIAQVKEWRKNNPEKARLNSRIQSHRRRVRVAGNTTGSSYTVEYISILKVLQKNRCAFCAKSIKKYHEVDHIHPIASGGSNEKSNIQLLCRSCNRSKQAKDPIDYAQAHGRLL